MAASSARKRIGPYRVIGELGKGGMGVVHHAVHEPLQRAVAIKELLAKTTEDKEAIERFRREGLALAQLRHESVVGIHDLFVARDKLYMVLEFVDGYSLFSLLAAEQKLPWDVAATIGMRLAAALEHAHHHKVIHRDLKPGNVMISKTGEVKLMDFGIARDQTLDTLTKAGVAVGTPMYMPPEVLAGGKADGQSDLYSLGVLLYECASGSRPFSGTSAEKVFMAILSGKYEPLKRKASGLPRGFLDIVERCMQRDPKKRFPNAAELHRALENLLESAGAAANHRARLVGFLHEKKKLTETEALTYLEPWEVVDLESAVSLDVPPPSLVRFLLAALSLSALCATYLWSTQGAGFFEAIARAARP